MTIFKCKICGGSLNVSEGATVAECEFCGTKQTLPKISDERRINLYDRANHFRRNNDYDKAMSVFEQILNEDKTDAEAYWSIVLCRFGVEYVEDPATRRRVPTVNRTQLTSIFADEDYKSAIKYSDGYQRAIYEEEAREIDKIQKEILAISDKEAPFDVFICYKESGSDGRRTLDSVLAQELYFGLKNEGINAFFSRITLEDKLGTAYEPYIFAALNSAKIMVVLGTRPEHFDAVWVKNEWSRYLALIKNGANKTLIPAYRDMDPYDLPDEFSHLQAQDMSKLGFMQDLIRGIKKIIGSDKSKVTNVVKETVVVNEGHAVAPLLKRAFLFIEDGDFDSADEYCEKVLDMDPECAEAYVAKLLIDLSLKSTDQLPACLTLFSDNPNYVKAVRFANPEYKALLQKYGKDNSEYVASENEKARKESIYSEALNRLSPGHIVNGDDYKASIEDLKSIIDYKDSAEQIERITQKLDEWTKRMLEQEERDRIRAEQERIDAEERQKQKELENKRKIKIGIIAFVSFLAVMLVTVIISVIVHQSDLNARSGLILEERNGHYVVTGVEEVRENIIIPSSYKGKAVTGISYNPFVNSRIKSIEIPSSITNINEGAFEGCTGLTSITIDQNNLYYKSVDGNLYSKSGKTLIAYAIGKTATSFTVPDGVETIASSAFYGCTNIKSITIPSRATLPSLHPQNNYCTL